MKSVSLLTHVNQRFEDFDRRLVDARMADAARVQLALTAAKEAVDKAEQANEKRLGLLNEFRNQSAEESRKYVPRETYELAIGQVNAQIKVVETASAMLQGRAIAFAGFGALLGGAAVALIMRALT
jgi:hypothetical protein